jgi:hypothetical protein
MESQNIGVYWIIGKPGSGKGTVFVGVVLIFILENCFCI